MSEDGVEPRKPRRHRYKYRYKYLQPDTKESPRDADAKQQATAAHDDTSQAAEESPRGEQRDDEHARNAQPERAADPDKARRDKRRKRFIFGGIAALFVLLALIWLLLYLFVFSKRETTDDAYVGGDQVAISSKITGTVIDVLVDDTDFVRAGQVLVKLDPADAGAALLQAEGALAQATRQVQQQSQSAAQADAAVAARQADVARANDDYRRKQPLLAEKAIAPEEVSASLQQLNAARAALDQAQRQAKAAHALIDEADVRSNPGVVQARAQYITAWVNNGRNTIIAPIDGYAAQRDVQVGQQVQPGQRLLVIVPLDRLWVDANFKERQLANIRIGQPVELTADMYGGDVVYHGHVRGLAAGTGGAFALLPPQNASGNWIKIVQRLPVRIALDPAELHAHPLRVGLSTDVKVDIHDRSGAVLATEPRNTSLASTSVYTQELDRAAAAADAIIQRNILGTGPDATGKP